MAYKIVFLPSAYKDLRLIPQQFAIPIRNAIYKLRSDPKPHNASKMIAYPQHYKLRVGRYRVIYHFHKRIEIITIIKVKHRKDAYK